MTVRELTALHFNGNQAQYVYFLLSGAVALAIIVLAYISVRTTLDSKLREDLGALQKTFNYMKPSWSYNNTWRQIGSKANHLIYSAYFDDRLDVWPINTGCDTGHAPTTLPLEPEKCRKG
ncbi:unnamed protein product [Ceratitis capitata]|uniref:(Mediterranean fruit fly) hypothetical protein n=1 Tax=Ceratitis capitata TaxID=7213 RepID=A0A811VIJ7_CERCA|nr:unnamed protein product [Ceratitis capitata]